MTRWTKQETAQIAVIRERLADYFRASPQYPEVVGDRKIIRFLRGHDHDLEKVCDLLKKFFNWRKTDKIDEVRKNIVEGGMDHPLKFPKGELILSKMPQLVIAPDATDHTGAPICVEQYNFSPAEVLKLITLADYVEFLTYALEYKSIIVEQMSQEREEQYLASLTPEERRRVDSPDCKDPPYGVIVNTCVIRDLGAVGFDHLSARGMEIIKAVVVLASDYYPELMRKCYMINTPWLFHTAWFIVKGLLAARTLAKVSVMGTSYQSEISKEVDLKNLPAIAGGTYIGYTKYVRYPFNLQYLCPDNQAKVPAITVPVDGNSANNNSNNNNEKVSPNGVVKSAVNGTTTNGVHHVNNTNNSNNNIKTSNHTNTTSHSPTNSDNSDIHVVNERL